MIININEKYRVIVDSNRNHIPERFFPKREVKGRDGQVKLKQAEWINFGRYYKNVVLAVDFIVQNEIESQAGSEINLDDYLELRAKLQQEYKDYSTNTQAI